METQTAPGGAQYRETSGTPISITPMTVFTDITPGPESGYTNAYTRLIITSRVSGGGTGNGQADTDYAPYKARDPISRFFWGVHSSLNLSANVTLSGGAAPYTASATLLSMDHVSDSANGERFTRVVMHRAENFPLFLVGQDGTHSIVSVKFDLKASDTATGTGAANALAVATGAIKLVSPQAAVLSTLSAATTQNLATALDKAVDQLFSKSIEEEPSGDRDIRTWQPGEGISVQLVIPAEEGDWTGRPVNNVGTWTVTFDDPQPSIFDSVKICANGASHFGLTGASCLAGFDVAARQAEKDINPSAVLNFPLTNGGTALGTVSAYLAQQAGFTSAITGFAGGVNANDVAKLCRAINSSMITIGLNSIDAGIVTVAARSMTQIPRSAAALMAAPTNASACGFAVPLH